jgi:pimeloyl-ACP methyl ester carboxylesterase
MSTDTERRELIRPDATIAYWVSGPERAPVVLLLHGATLDHRAWDAQVDELTPQYRVVVPDLRGHGESTLEGAFRFDDAVDDVAALLDAVDRAPSHSGPEPRRQMPRRSCTTTPGGWMR